MNVTAVHSVTFSPAGSTKFTVDLLAGFLSDILRVPVIQDSFTLPAEREKSRSYSGTDLVIFGVPTYAGRIPNKILPAVQSLFHGTDTPAIAVVTFGNRSYDSSLKELRRELENNSFRIFAAAAVASRHVFTDKLAPGRPDEEDKTLLHSLACSAAEKLTAAEQISALLPAVLNDDSLPVAPYYTPLDENGQPAKFLKAVPAVDTALCEHCGKCAAVCPMGSVSPDDPACTTGICIKCHACILNCPAHCRTFTDPAMLSHIRMLEKNYTRRADSAVFV